MDFPKTRALPLYLHALESAGSTNAELLAMADAPDRTVVVTLDQTAGRGRLGRSWTAPAGSALAVSVLLPGPPSPWLPLLAGAAMSMAVSAHVVGVEVKWPNDVLVNGRKVSGILAEIAPDGRVVVGAGVNLTMTEDELPVRTATSLAIELAAYGAAPPDDLADRVLAAYLTLLFAFTGMDDEDARFIAQLRCATVGRRVRVELPDGTSIEGRAAGLDAQGRLEVDSVNRGRTVLAAGDVHHLREVGRE